MTDFPNTSQLSQVTSADTTPDQINTTAASLTGAVEGLYATVTSENSAADEAVYSGLDGGTASTASHNDKRNEHAGNKESIAPMSELPLDSDPVYHILECGDYQM